MKKTKILFLFIPMILLLTACNSNTSEQKSESTTQEANMIYKMISQKEAKQIMETRMDITILDVRTKEEYNEGHIPGAICIPNETIDKEPKELQDKEQTILVYCRSGRRSKEAAKKLATLGYTDIQEFGGILDWQYEITKDK